jgi:hypothetical protein
MLAKWFTPAMLAGLVRSGLATVERDVVKIDGSTSKITRYHITDAGRKALQS